MSKRKITLQHGSETKKTRFFDNNDDVSEMEVDPVVESIPRGRGRPRKVVHGNVYTEKTIVPEKIPSKNSFTQIVDKNKNNNKDSEEQLILNSSLRNNFGSELVNSEETFEDYSKKILNNKNKLQPNEELLNIDINRDKNLEFNRHIRPEPVKSLFYNEYCLNRDKNLDFNRNIRREPVKSYDFINEHSSSFSKRKTGCGFEPIPSNHNTIEQFYQNDNFVGNSTLSKITPVINKPPIQSRGSISKNKKSKT